MIYSHKLFKSLFNLKSYSNEHIFVQDGYEVLSYHDSTGVLLSLTSNEVFTCIYSCYEEMADPYHLNKTKYTVDTYFCCAATDLKLPN